MTLAIAAQAFKFIRVRLPTTLDPFRKLYEGLELIYIRTPMLEWPVMSIHSRLGRGWRDAILPLGFHLLLTSFDFFIHVDGWTHYFVVTLFLGVGITVWHKICPQDCDCGNSVGYDSLRNFHDLAHYHWGFDRIALIEDGSYAHLIKKIMEEVYPFNEIDYDGLFRNGAADGNPSPLNSTTCMYLFGLATALVFFVACGVVPDEAMVVTSSIPI